MGFQCFPMIVGASTWQVDVVYVGITSHLQTGLPKKKLSKLLGESLLVNFFQMIMEPSKYPVKLFCHCQENVNKNSNLKWIISRWLISKLEWIVQSIWMNFHFIFVIMAQWIKLKLGWSLYISLDSYIPWYVDGLPKVYTANPPTCFQIPVC